MYHEVAYVVTKTGKRGDTISRSDQETIKRKIVKYFRCTSRDITLSVERVRTNSSRVAVIDLTRALVCRVVLPHGVSPLRRRRLPRLVRVPNLHMHPIPLNAIK